LQALKVYVNEVKVKKRRKVEQTDPNKKFATVANVIRTRIDIEPICHDPYRDIRTNANSPRLMAELRGKEIRAITLNRINLGKQDD